MSSLGLEGDGLRQFLREGITGWTCLEVPMGDEVYQVHVRRPVEKIHTQADEPARAATLDECTDVIGRLFIAVSAAGEMRRREEARRGRY